MDKLPPTSPLSQKWKLWLLLLVLPLPLALLGFSGLAAAGPMLADFTPTVIIYLPVIVKVPTPTFTPTLTFTPTPPATFTPVATAAPTQPAYPGGSTSVSGNVSLDLARKPGGGTYATWCENVWFDDWIHNDDGARSLNWTVLGVSLTGPNNYSVFHTSWSNQTGWFTLYPNYYGPLNAPTSGAGQWVDAVSGPGHPDTLITNPGNYTLTEATCLSSFGTCRSGSGWHTFNSVTFTTVNWGTPQQCPKTSSQAVVDPFAGCHLDMSDPQNVHMVCPSK